VRHQKPGRHVALQLVPATYVCKKQFRFGFFLLEPA
jgi:hypothetical protein